MASISFLGASFHSLAVPGPVLSSVVLSPFAVSRQQPHTSELGRQEGVEDKHHRLWTRVEVKHLERAGRQGNGVKEHQKAGKKIKLMICSPIFANSFTGI